MTSPSISFIVPTTGRDTLAATLASIDQWAGDELLVIQHDPPARNYGASERHEGTERATKDYLAYLDDDNIYVPGHRAIMAQAIHDSRIKFPEAPHPILFRVQYPNGQIIWRKPWIKNGNIDTQMILVPNLKEKLTPWNQPHPPASRMRWSCCDYYFVSRWHWSGKRSIFWCPQIIALMGHGGEARK